MPGVSLIIPWRDGCPHRAAALAWVTGRYRRLGWEPIIGTCSEGAWCKAEAVADGIRRTDGDLLVVADADVWSDAVSPAVAVVAAGAGWVAPRCEVRRLTADATGQVLAGAEPDMTMPLEQKAYRGMLAGGLVVLSRQAWETAPLDAKFTGFGQEDEAWEIALTKLVGRPVVLDWPGWPLWHLWHPPQERMSRSVGSQAGDRRRRQYMTARGSPARLRALIEEGRPVCLSSPNPT